MPRIPTTQHTAGTATAAKIKADDVSVVAGSSAVGGWDHLKVLLLAARALMMFAPSISVAFDGGGGKCVTQLLAGSVQAFTGDASEARALWIPAISSDRSSRTRASFR
ncbi:MAG: hypothetical protein R3D29_16010 [Nitratireductor sp.]